jgi:hypothetical protein
MLESKLPAILYYRVLLATSAHFTRVGLWLDMEIRENVDYITLLFPDGKRAEFAADEVEAYRNRGSWERR